MEVRLTELEYQELKRCEDFERKTLESAFRFRHGCKFGDNEVVYSTKEAIDKIKEECGDLADIRLEADKLQLKVDRLEFEKKELESKLTEELNKIEEFKKSFDMITEDNARYKALMLNILSDSSWFNSAKKMIKKSGIELERHLIKNPRGGFTKQ